MKPQIKVNDTEFAIFKIEENTDEVFLMEATYIAGDIERCQTAEEVIQLMKEYSDFKAGEMRGHLFIPYFANHKYSGLDRSEAFDTTTGQFIELNNQ
ncbi:MAG: hypothetical protein EDM75_16310 [Chlorobiota bacterium]|nr:MAG: hypothetical protein EDM75_16310 [Chlorobiota bacterium]